jgi:glycine dehydrogenase
MGKTSQLDPSAGAPEPHTRHEALNPTDMFARRHIGPRHVDVGDMLATVGVDSLDALMRETIPESIRAQRPLDLDPARTEHDLLHDLQELAGRNQVFTSCIGMGYSDTFTPPVILRNVLENPGWYTQYTPYQSEISQGRLEALLTYQTLVADLTALPVANASLLDEATAAAEGMAMCLAIAGGRKRERSRFFAARDCHPQTLAVVRSRARALGIQVVLGDLEDLESAEHEI